MKCSNCGSQFRLLKAKTGFICNECEIDQAMEEYGLISNSK
jgi:hypothetical protein